MIYFVTETYLKNNTPITNNVDVTDVMPYVATQARLRIKSILGSYFYDDILTKYNAQTLDANETTLVEYIQPVIAWYSAEDAVFGLSYQLKNKGVQQQFGDYSNAVSKDEIAFNMDHYNQKAEIFEKDLIAWLLDNKTLFPNFTSTTNKDSIVKPIDDCDDDLDNYFNTLLVI
jgi:hypothetical protein